ncbi:MAG: DUF2291 family protein [Demequinaceae bacterium]|nr:DUF2291 family protein [Demequinaceae bacterium]
MKPSVKATGHDQMSVFRRLTTGRSVFWVALVLVVIAAALSTKVVSIEDDTGRHVFDAKEYAETYFESVTMPAILDTAVDLQTVLAAIEEDEDQAKEEYGNSSNPYNPYSYPVILTAVAGEVSENGKTVALTVDGLSPDYTVQLQIVPGTQTALRDVTGFVDLNQFLNQVEYLQVSLEFNYKAEELVLEPFLEEHPADTLAGQTLQITGAFIDNVPKVVTVIAVSIEIVSEP